jgi:hypothetical protein
MLVLFSRSDFHDPVKKRRLILSEQREEQKASMSSGEISTFISSPPEEIDG